MRCKAGVPFEVVPGISSAVAIPAEAGIPVTQRGVSRAVHIITAQAGGKGTPPMDYRPCAAWGGTLVFLMGVARLPQIAADLMAGGLSPLRRLPLCGAAARRPAPCAATWPILQKRPPGWPRRL